VAVRLSLKANAQIHGLRLRGACYWLHLCSRCARLPNGNAYCQYQTVIFILVRI
jgi:hypothetical protein